MTIDAAQATHRERINRLFAGEAVEQMIAIAGDFHGYYGAADDNQLTTWVRNELPGVVAAQREVADDPVNFRPLLVEFVPFGVHYVDALFGARIFHFEDQWWSELLPGTLADLTPIDVAAAPLFRWTLTALESILAALPPDHAVTFPIYSSPLNVAINLFGEAVLMELYDPTPATMAGLDVLTTAIIDLHRLTNTHFSSPRVRFYCSCSRYAPDDVGHICGCSTQLLGPETYARTLAPRDAALLASYPSGGTLHLCGHHTQHLPTWRAMPSLRAVQLNDAAADELPLYLRGLRDDQLIYIGPTAEMPVARIHALCGGHRIILQEALPSPLPVCNISVSA